MPVPPTPLRRAVTIPAVMVFMVISVALLIVVTVVTGPVSLCLRGRWRAVRLGSFLVIYLATEITALAGAFTIWAGSGRQAGSRIFLRSPRVMAGPDPAGRRGGMPGATRT